MCVCQSDNQSSFEEGDSILFEGSALDNNVDATELVVTFASDKDGELGEGTLASSGVAVFGNGSVVEQHPYYIDECYG